MKDYEEKDSWFPQKDPSPCTLLLYNNQKSASPALLGIWMSYKPYYLLSLIPPRQ